jgi:uncharacterized protein YfaT (DUF1175 family)
LKPSQSQSDSESRKKPGKQPAAKSDGQPEGLETAQGGARSDEHAAQDSVRPDEQAAAQSGAHPEGDAAEKVGGPAANKPHASEPVAARVRANENPRTGGQVFGQPMRVAARVPGGLQRTRLGRRAGSDLGWLRWGLMLPVLGLTVWAAAGILAHGLNGSWRGEESLFRVEAERASGAGAGHTGAAHTTGGAAAGVGPSETQGREPAWKNPATWTDGFGDGTPDFLRLTDEADREAFRQWFAQIADYQAMRPQAQVPKEITDCASLLRYAYREALKKHDAGWFKDTGMEVGALPGEIQAWHYPDTPLGTGLFRITQGPFVQGDESDGAFAQFADAKTLVERNAYLVSRNVWQAEPGDLLFYRQFGQSSPWHSMIVTRVGSGAAVVYDTGEDHGAAGELRRVELTDLLAHPQAEWRPLTSNPNFMGVYRWNILRGSL